MSAPVEEEKEPKIVFNSEPNYQKKSYSECQQDVSIQLRYQNKVVQNVIRMSHRHYVNMSICRYVNVRMQLFSLGIKMKAVHNVIRMSDSHKISSDS